MKRTILGLLSLVCLLLIGCTQQKLDKSESLRDAYFQIAEKLVNKEEISSKYIKKLLSGYEYKKDEEFLFPTHYPKYLQYNFVDYIVNI